MFFLPEPKPASRPKDMHRIFKILEILDHILSSISRESPRYGGTPIIPRKQLLSCALTCTTFKDPSLDLLWRDVWGIKQLLLLLPQDALKRNNKHQWTLECPLTKEDWSRFNTYAYRVSSLSFSCVQAYFINPLENILTRSYFSKPFFRSLHQSYCASNAGPMLPRLKTFALTPHTLSDIDCCLIFMASKLDTVNFHRWEHDGRSSSDCLESFCRALTRSHARHTIRDLILPEYLGNGDTDPSSHFLPLLQMLPHLTSLKRIELGDNILNQQGVFKCLVEMKGLEELVTPRMTLITDPPHAEHGQLCNLRTLDMIMRNIHTIAHLLKNGTLKTLKASGVETAGNDLALLSSKGSSLETLDIFFGGGELDPISGIPDMLPSITVIRSPLLPIPRILSPLFSTCKGLLNVKVTFLLDRGFVDPSDDDYLAIAQAWPLLQAFMIQLPIVTDPKEPLPDPSATVQGTIQAFAMHCPDLRSLILQSEFAWDPQAVGPWQPIPALEALEVGDIILSETSNGNTIKKRVHTSDTEVWNYLWDVSGGTQDRNIVSFTKARTTWGTPLS